MPSAAGCDDMITQTYFKIDFLQPGKNLVPPSGVLKLLDQLKSIQVLFVKQLYRKVSTSATLLIICFGLLAYGNWFFHEKIYLPRERTLEENALEIKKIQEQISALKIKIQQQQAAEKARADRLQQLRTLKKASIGWQDKLMGIQRTMVSKVWLTSMEVNDTATPVEVTLKGATRIDERKDKDSDLPRDKPLRLISEFINTLMSDPAWHSSFDLKDWNISTSKELVTFQLSLERK